MTHSHDWVERIRRTIWPALDLESTVGPDQYVGHLMMNVEDFEAVLHEHGLIRNAPAFFKSSNEGKESIGSWVFLPDGYFGHDQVHITIVSDGGIFVHREYNWRRHPIRHLRGNYFTFPVEEYRRKLELWQVPFVVKDQHDSSNHH